MQTGGTARPFLKWVGGKNQLLKEIRPLYPFDDEQFNKYAEPFVGGGAVLFDILNTYNLKEAYISDINLNLIATYLTVRDAAESLIAELKELEEKFVPLDQEGRKSSYLEKREEFNQLIEANSTDNLRRAALMIFLNRTCFNGLYRVNRKGLFNVPCGKYKNPTICDAENLRAASRKLQKVQIHLGDYREAEQFIDERTFVYLDPPYRPLGKTANFTAYTQDGFDDHDQLMLAKFVDLINDRGARVVLSNSDPKNVDESDGFFDQIYEACKIRRVQASRMINSDSSKRNKINELLISNF